MVWPDFVILSEPCVDGDLRLSGAVEPFGIQDFSSQSSVEAFVAPIFPRASGVNPDRIDSNFS